MKNTILATLSTLSLIACGPDPVRSDLVPHAPAMMQGTWTGVVTLRDTALLCDPETTPNCESRGGGLIPEKITPFLSLPASIKVEQNASSARLSGVCPDGTGDAEAFVSRDGAFFTGTVRCPVSIAEQRNGQVLEIEILLGSDMKTASLRTYGWGEFKRPGQRTEYIGLATLALQ